jgi:mycothiol synthase
MSSDRTLHLPGSPDMAGLRYRGPRPETDFPKMSDIYNLVAPIGNPQFTPQTPAALAQESEQQTPDHGQDQLIVEVEGEMIGWGSCDTFRQRKNLYIGSHDFFLRPEWRERGIELAAIRYFETRVAERLRDCPAEQAIYKIAVNEADSQRVALLQAANYTQLAAHANMVRPDLEHIPDYALPDGIAMRPAAEAHLREIYEAHREAFQEHIHGVDPSDEDFDEWSRAEVLADRSLWVVAWEVQTNKIAGVILNYILEGENTYHHRQRGYVEYISVLRPYRRRGLARAMIAASLRRHKERGMQEAALSSHTENPFNPISLYTAMGFQVRYHTLIFSKPVRQQARCAQKTG